jgi:hypothetical protein
MVEGDWGLTLLPPSEPDTVFENLDLDASLRADLLANIARRMTPKPVKVRSDLELTCYSYEGINGIKSALRAGEAMSTEQVPLKIRLVAPPLYVMTTTSTDKNAAIETMERALEKIGEEIEKYDGTMNVAMRVSPVRDGERTKLILFSRSPRPSPRPTTMRSPSSWRMRNERMHRCRVTMIPRRMTSRAAYLVVDRCQNEKLLPREAPIY